MPSIKEALALLRDYYTNPFNYSIPNTTFIDRYGQLRANCLPLADLLQDRLNLHLLGEGNFSKVYAVSERVVLKIDLNVADGSYRTYTDFVVKHQSNPYLPKIYYRAKFGAHNVYVLERLQPFDAYETPPIINALYGLQRTRKSGVNVRVDDPHINEIIQCCPVDMDDTHSRNIMLRGEQIVLTDPCS